MKRLLRSFTLALAAVLLWSLPQPAAASHFRFANLSWKRAPGTNSLAVEITVTEAWRISSGGIGEIFYQFGDGSPGFSTATATRVATLSDVVGEQYEVWRHTTTHTYPSNDVFTVSGSSCCRISTLVNAADASESLTMLVDLRNPANTGSPVTTAPVILQMQAGTNNSVALPIVDPDGDAFSVRFATSAESSISSLPTVGANTISVTAGGVLNWNTIGGASGQKFALQVIIEENRAGNPTGTNGRVPLDFIIELAGSLTNLTPTVTGTNGSITLAPNQTFTTTFVGTDPEGGPLRVNHQGLPPGATITPADGTTNASPASVMFSWTPAPADVGSSYAVLIFFTDQGGLQRAASFALTVSASAVVRDFELLSINAAGTASGSGASLNPVVSSNGQYVAFVSDAANLVANDNNGARDVFWRDRVSGTTRLVSRTPAGASGNNESDAPVISADGRYVAFHSRASDLVAGDTNAGYDVFLWDAQDNSVTLVSRTATGASGAGDSFVPRLSANGRVVAFLSLAGNLVPNDTNETTDAFAYNLDTAVMSLASVNTNGQSGNGFTGVPALSADGRHVAFVSRATDLVTNDTSTTEDVFVRDLQLGVTRLVSVNVAGTGGGSRLSFDPVISADGRFIAFASGATNLVAVPDLNNFPDIFVRDTQLGMTKLASINRLGTAAGSDGGNPAVRPLSFKPVLSADGTKVLFESAAADLVLGDNNNGRDVFLRDLVGDTTTLVSVNRFGTGAGTGLSAITPYSLSADLRYIAFLSDAADLGAADTNGKTDVFLRDLATNSTKIISRVNLGGFSGSGHSFQPVLSADGSTVFFTSEAENLDSRDANAVSDVFAASTALGTPNFGVVDVGVSISTVTGRTVGSSFTLTVTVTNHSAAPATGLVLGNSGPSLLQFLSGTASQGTIGTNSWVVGDLAANGSATAVVTLVATNLGEGDVIVSIIRRDQLDSNLNNNAALSTITVNQTAAGALFYLPGNTAYLSRTNSPFFADILSGAVTLEAFERGNFSLAGVTASAGTNFAASASTDSVDADDGLVDGNGNGGQSFLVTGTNAVTFSFNAAILGRLPTKVGIVLTDGDDEGAGIEVFGTNGVLLGVLGPFAIGDNVFTGETAEDRFLGAEFAGGISAVRVFYASPGFELDHLQFDIPTTDLAMSGTGPGTAAFGSNFVLTLTVTNRGPVTATGVVVTNADPGDVNFLGVTTSQGTVDTMTGSWSVGTLAAGASATFTATLTPGGSGLLLFRAGVSSALPDAHTANDSVSLGVTVPNLAPNIRFASNTLVLPEDLPALSFPAFAQVHPQETNQLITNVTVTVDNPALFAVPPGFQTNGTLELTLAGNAVGTAVVTVTATDNGGTLAGGVPTGSNSFVINVTAVNDAPAFGFSTNHVVVLEDAGLQTVAGFITGLSVGPGDESGQSITNYLVTTSSNALFAVLPAISSGGVLTFTPAVNANGSATITVIAQDDGGTANGGLDKATNAFTLTLTAVNDAPSLAFATNNLVVAEDAGAQLVAGFVTATLGPADEAGQVITNYSVSSDNPALFTVAPAISLGGDLTFTVSNNVSGTTIVTVIAADSGGTANGGVDRVTNTFTLTVNDINDAPVITFTTNLLVALEDSGANTLAAFATFATVESGQAITNVTTTNSNPALFSVQPFFTVGGTLMFTPFPEATGTGVVTVIVQDDGGTASGGVDRATNTFAIAVLPVNTAPTFTLTNFPAADGVLDWERDAFTNVALGVKVAVDASGNVIVAGDEYLGQDYNIVVAKYSPAGTLLWTNTFSGSPGGTDQVKGLALDSAGNVLITGASIASTYDYVTLKYSAAGVAVWTNYFDNGGDDTPEAITVDSAGNVLVTGHSKNGLYGDYLTIKYLADGTPVWTNRTSYAGPGNDTAKSVAVDASGDVYVTGDGSNTDYTYAFTLKFAGATGTPVWTNQFDINGENSYGVALAVDGSGDVLVAANYLEVVVKFAVVKYSSAGVPVWTNRYDRASGQDQHLRAMAVDGSGSAIVTGETYNGTDFDYTILKVLSSGVAAWTNHYDGVGGGVADYPLAITVSSSADVFVTGHSTRTNGKDFLTVKYSAAGAGVWTNRYDSASHGDDQANALAVDASGNVFVTGTVGDPVATSVLRTIKYAFTPADGANQTMLNTVGAVTVTGFIASSSVGTTNESAQTLSFIVTNDNNALFTVQPAISPAGVLTYTVAGGGSGLAVVTVRAQDNGGTASGGMDTSAQQTFNITVLSGSSSVFYVWLGGSGDWNDPSAWTPRGVPGVADSAFMGSGTIQLTNTVTVAILTHDGGTLDGAGSVTVRSNMTWTGGVMSGAGTTTIANGATLTVSGAADKDLRRRLDNYGTVTWTAGRILGHTSATLYNYAGALFDTQSEATLFESGDGTIKTFHNFGTVRKSAGTGTSAWSGTFNNSGTVTVQTGTLNPVGTVTLNTSTYSGAGKFLLTGCTLAGTLAIESRADVDFASGTMLGTGIIVGTLNWTGGMMGSGGTTTIATNGVLLISGTTDKDLRRTLDNYGTVTWTDARILGHSSPIINNQAGAVFEARANTTLYESGDGTIKTFNNSGTVRRTVGTGNTVWSGLFNNSATLIVETGMLSLSGGGTSAGSFTNLAGATLEFSGGTHTLNDGMSFTGAGLSQIAGGAVNITAGATASVTGTFGLASGSLGGTGTFLVTSGSQFNWTGGTMDGTTGVTVITNGATLTASGAADKDLRRRLDNHGTVAWTTGRILGHSTPVINNYAGALFDTGTDATLFESGDGTVKTLNNAGTVRKSGGTGTSLWYGVFNQGGAAEVQTGTLNPGGTVTLNTSSHSGAGRFLITGATLAGTLTIASGANVELASGALAGTGTLAGTLNWTGGTIGSGGTLTIATNGALVVSTTADKDLRQALDNYGTVTWMAGRLLGHGSPVIHNRAGAVFEARADATLFDSGDGTVKTFNNSGKVRRTTGTGTTLWYGLLNNDGLVAAESGTLSLTGGGTSSGTFTNVAGAMLTFSGGTQTLNDGASFTGAGTNQIAGGTVNVNAGATVSAAGLFELSSGTLDGTGTFLVTSGSQFNWTGGTMAGTTGITVITNGATLIASSGADKDLRRRLDNYGTVTWTAGRILGHATPTLNNYAGALFDAQVDATLFDSADGTVKTFNNAGTLRKSAGTGTTTVYGTFNLGGTANVQTGTLNPIGTVTATAAGYSGAGRFLFTTGTLDGTQTVAAGANVELASGTLLGTWTLAGTMNWTSGTLGAGGSTTIPAGSTLLVSSAADKDLRRTLDNSGTVLWTGGRLLGHSTPVINNNAGAVFETQVAATLFESADGTTKTFNNTGTVRKSAATGTTTFHGTFNQNGGLEIQLGVLSLVNGFAPAAGSSLKVFLGGLTAGTQFGQLQVGGSTAFTGTLNLVLTNSFVPVAGNTFLVVDSGSGSGTFSSLTGDALGGGLTLVPGYAGGDLTLTATMIASLPPLSPQAVGPERLLRWPGDAGGYVLETASSITGPWAPVLVPVAQENGDSVVRLPAGGTRFYRLVPVAPPRPGDNPTQ